MKKATALLFFFSLTALIVNGCSKKESAPTASIGGAATTEGTATTATVEGAATTEGSAPAIATGGSTVGVPECDEYIDKYQKCLGGKVPEAAQAAMKGAFDQAVDAWRQAAATPEGKASLAMGCRGALDAAKQSMGAYGCEW